MKANELRVGNLVKHNGNWSYRSHSAPTEIIWTDSDWYALGECTMDLNDIEPVPLTEEWLLKYDHYLPSSFEIYQRKERIHIYHFGHYLATCDYLHEWQNLHFALTNEELTLKQ
jgi:hypothetical protein